MVIGCLAGRRWTALSFHDLTHRIRVNEEFSKLQSPSAAVIQQMFEPHIEQLLFLLETFHYSKMELKTRIPSCFSAPEMEFSRSGSSSFGGCYDWGSLHCCAGWMKFTPKYRILLEYGQHQGLMASLSTDLLHTAGTEAIILQCLHSEKSH